MKDFKKSWKILKIQLKSKDLTTKKQLKSYKMNILTIKQLKMNKEMLNKKESK